MIPGTVFSINIAKRVRANIYAHYCKVIARDDEAHAREVWAAMRNRFPAPDWEVTMSSLRTIGQELTWKS